MQVASPRENHKSYVRNSRYRYMSVDTDAHVLRCRGLSWDTRGALDAIRIEMWRRGAPFPDDDKTIADAIGMHLNRWRRIRPELESLFDLSGGTWREPEIEKAQAFAERCSGTTPKSPTTRVAKPLKTATRAACKQVRIDPQGGDLSMAQSAPAAPAPQREAPTQSNVRNGEGRSRSRPRHPSWTRGTAIDPDWDPGDEGRAYARQAGRDDTWIARQAQRFRLHHRSRGTICSDWAARWQLWVERSPEFEPAHKPTYAEQERGRRQACAEWVMRRRREREEKAHALVVA